MVRVTAIGKVDQVVQAIAGVYQVVRDMVLNRYISSEAVNGQQATSRDSASGWEEVKGESEGTECTTSYAPVTLSVVMVVNMEAAGKIIGKRGQNIEALQKETDSMLRFLDRHSSPPGLRCGDRLLDIVAGSELALNSAAGAILRVLASGAGDQASCHLAVPPEAVAFIIGKGGGTIAQLASKSGATMGFDASSYQKAAFRQLQVSGDIPDCADAVVGVASKLAELRARGALPKELRNGASTVAAQGLMPRDTSASKGSDSADNSGRSRGGQHIRVDDHWFDTRAEQELFNRISARCMAEQRLTMRVPASVVDALPQVAEKSAAVLEVGQEDHEGYCFVTAVGNKMSTCVASYYIQDSMLKG
mmetsp:Transcript_33739/g.75119  ORF Transcript_33739/g.75119 Transcript_33739/m.75119 type:complete len:362 (+) Transcript_33739:459-1544(+)